MIADDNGIFEAQSRSRLLTFLALLFVAAQLVFAAHAAAKSDYLLDHSAGSCAVCLSGAASDDPALLVVNIAAPVPIFADVAAPHFKSAASPAAVLAAKPRGPPLR